MQPGTVSVLQCCIFPKADATAVASDLQDFGDMQGNSRRSSSLSSTLAVCLSETAWIWGHPIHDRDWAKSL